MTCSFFLRTLKIIIYAISLSYFLGMIWLIISKVESHEVATTFHMNHFFTHYEVHERYNFE